MREATGQTVKPPGTRTAQIRSNLAQLAPLVRDNRKFRLENRELITSILQRAAINFRFTSFADGAAMRGASAARRSCVN
jgi:hypothetical protein